jgi:RimJ/RimL family protein N-acetyltransferase
MTQEEIRAGRICKVFRARDGRKVTLRTPRWDDLDDMLEMINSLVEEGADIIMDQKQTRDQELNWLARALSEQEKKEKTYVAAEVDGKLIANSQVNRIGAGRQSHVGILGIAIRDGYRNIGIGTQMMKTLIDEGKKMGLKVLVLDMFATNTRAKHVYEKMGFKEVGRIPKGLFKDGKYIDEVRMALELGAITDLKAIQK